MRMGQGVRTGLGHGGITCVLQTQFSSFLFFFISVSSIFIFLLHYTLCHLLDSPHRGDSDGMPQFTVKRI